jgi:ribosomal protein L11 methyltransferase
LKLSPGVELHDAGSLAISRAPGVLALPQLPSSAFGDGTHPTTRLCAGAVDFLCRQGGVSSLLDVGTGSGVLARIARARGVRFVAATEIDAASAEAARANASLDGAASDIPVLDVAPDHWGPVFELVVANILEEVLRAIAPALRGALAPGGELLVSGFTRLQSPAMRIAFAELELVSEAELEGWVLLRLRRG